MPYRIPSMREAILKTVVSHTVTYFVIGVLSFLTFNYAVLYSDPSVSAFVRETTDPLVTAGPLFQPIRGLLFGVVFYLLREPFFGRSRGWIALWATLVVIGILGPFGAAPGSLEGLVYTRLPLAFQLTSLPEILVQSLLLSALLFYWVQNHEKKWISWVLGILFFLMVLFPALGLLVGQAG